MSKKKEEQFCGCCCWFYAEDTYGYGGCPFQFAEIRQCEYLCNIKKKFISKEQMRHYVAVLRQANRCRRDDHVPAIYKMPNPTELGKAIDFACEYIKVFSDI